MSVPSPLAQCCRWPSVAPSPVPPPIAVSPASPPPPPEGRRQPLAVPSPRQGLCCPHLASGLGAPQDAQVHHQPGQDEAERRLPLHAPAVLDGRGDVESFPVPEVLRGGRLLTLLVVARVVVVQRAHGPWQGILWDQKKPLYRQVRAEWEEWKWPW